MDSIPAIDSISTTPPPLPPRRPPQPINPTPLEKRHRVYIGVSPLVGAGWVAYLATAGEKLFGDNRTTHSYAVVAWQDVSGGAKLLRYELLLKEPSLKTTATDTTALKNFSRDPSIVGVSSVSKTLASSTNSTYDPSEFPRVWSEANPSDRIFEIGWTDLTPADAQRFTDEWPKKHIKYNAFWDNCRTFVDTFCKYVVTERPGVWEVPLPGVTRVDKGTVVASAGKVFDSPLEYVHWCDKTSRAARRRNARSGATVRASTDSVVSTGQSVHDADVTSKIHVAVNLEGRIDVEIEDNGLGDDISLAEQVDGATAESVGWVDVKVPGQSPGVNKRSGSEDGAASLRSSIMKARESIAVPRLNVVITIVGSRGDVQPFIAFGKRLQRPSAKHPHGHRVRLATHETFRKFVTDAGLEFYPLAGDPAELMAYMVKNPGLLPGYESIRAGDIGKKRATMRAILSSLYKACTEAEHGMPPFTADVIVSNPPTFGHIHVAEKMGIPLHIFFTMPWLANIKSSNADNSLSNRVSYEVTEVMTWEGLGDVINEFRREELDLPGLPVPVAPWLLKNLKVPHSYMWSPNLIPKPSDWGDHIDVVGFFFLPGSGENNYTPPADLTAFLSHKDKPIVYIGFGSIVVDDPNKLTRMIFEAVEKAGVRAILSKGWGGLGGSELTVPENVYMLGACPHDWLFKNVAAVVHHGGAGTTATGLICGRPTVIVPFFGDQPFWGAMVARMGVGPAPIPFKSLTSENLAAAIQFCLHPDVAEAAFVLGTEMSKEDGVGAGVESFHKHLPLEKMICDIDKTLLADWYSEEANILLSTAVMRVLVEEGLLQKKKIYRYANSHWETDTQPTELLTGALGAAKSLTVGTTKGLASFFIETGSGIQKATKADSVAQGALEVAKGMGIGFGGTMYYSVKAGGRVVEKLSSGLKNTHNLVSGRPSTTPPAIHDAGSGFLEGAKSFGYGIGAGVGEFFVKPVEGAVKEGWVGALKGFGRGSVALVTLPTAGTMDLVVMSGKGLNRSVQKAIKGRRKERDAREQREGAGSMAGSDTEREKQIGDGTNDSGRQSTSATTTTAAAATAAPRTSSSSGNTDTGSTSSQDQWGDYQPTVLDRARILTAYENLLRWRVRADAEGQGAD
ncbi:hypothetical protein HDU93_003398 [Gonapodya sp. JEL0774]|nr:hypothetical protein HDU93_003398 [Gonapodya sp. JEL0774]